MEWKEADMFEPAHHGNKPFKQFHPSTI